MRIFFFGRDQNKLELCRESAHRQGIETLIFDTFTEAYEAHSPSIATAICSENVLVSNGPTVADFLIQNPGTINSPSVDVSLIGENVSLNGDIKCLSDINQHTSAVHNGHSPHLVASFVPGIPADYDFERYRRIPKFISFQAIPNASAQRAAAMAEMLQLLKGEPFSFDPFLEKKIVRQLSVRLRNGERLEPIQAGDFGVEKFVSVCNQRFKEDLRRLIPTVTGYHPEKEFHLFCDRETAFAAQEVVRAMIPKGDNVFIHDVITEKSIQEVEQRFNGVNQSNYWKPGPIWWKLEALRRVLEKDNRPTLLVDCDIVFAAPVEETFREVDLVMSPFYWPDPNLKVRIAPDNNKFVPIAERDGWYNAGYLLAARQEIPELWLQLYEQSVGGFYEQYCMGFLPQKFRHTVFGSAHNWGQWRREIPPQSVVSLHAHKRTEHGNPFGEAIQHRANKEASKFLSDV